MLSKVVHRQEGDLDPEAPRTSLSARGALETSYESEKENVNERSVCCKDEEVGGGEGGDTRNKKKETNSINHQAKRQEQKQKQKLKQKEQESHPGRSFGSQTTTTTRNK